MPNVVATLWQHWVWLGRTQCYYNIATPLKMNVISQCCHNVGKLHNFTMLAELWKWCYMPMFTQHSGNIVWMLYECWCPMLKSGQSTTFRQCCHNVVAMLKIMYFQCCHNVVTMLSEHCVNIVGWSKYQRSLNVGTIMLFSMLSQPCYNVGGTHQESKI